MLIWYGDIPEEILTSSNGKRGSWAALFLLFNHSELGGAVPGPDVTESQSRRLEPCWSSRCGADRKSAGFVPGNALPQFARPKPLMRCLGGRPDAGGRVSSPWLSSAVCGRAPLVPPRRPWAGGESAPLTVHDRRDSSHPPTLARAALSFRPVARTSCS